MRRGSSTTGVVQQCRRRGAGCAQVFISESPRLGSTVVLRRGRRAVRDAWTTSRLGPLAAAPYVLNIASPNCGFLARSRTLARRTARACDLLGVDLLVVHAGAGGTGEPARSRRRAARSLLETVGAAEEVRVLVELMARTLRPVASTIAEARLCSRIPTTIASGCVSTSATCSRRATDSTRTKVARRCSTNWRRTSSTGRVCLVHANDSAFPRGERRDRHAPIGEGAIGAEDGACTAGTTGGGRLDVRAGDPGDAASHAAQIALLRSLAPPDVARVRPFRIRAPPSVLGSCRAPPRTARRARGGAFLPESAFVAVAEPESREPFALFHAYRFGYRPERPAVLGVEVLAVVAPCEQHVVVAHRIERQVRRVAGQALRDHPLGASGAAARVRGSCGTTGTFPGVVERGPARDAMHVGVDRDARQCSKLLVAERNGCSTRPGPRGPSGRRRTSGSVRSAAPARSSRRR